MDEQGKTVRDYDMISVSLPASAHTANLRIGIAMDEWETVVAQKPDSLGTSSFTRDGQQFTVTFQEVTATSADTDAGRLHEYRALRQVPDAVGGARQRRPRT